jgi:hypothetical protein
MPFERRNPSNTVRVVKGSQILVNHRSEATMFCAAAAIPRSAGGDSQSGNKAFRDDKRQLQKMNGFGVAIILGAGRAGTSQPGGKGSPFGCASGFPPDEKLFRRVLRKSLQ